MLKLFSILLLLLSTQVEAKPFKRALVLAGGGISPAVGIGILAAAEESGKRPDVVITTCGSSMSAMIYNAYNNGRASLAYANSTAFYNSLKQVHIATNDVLVLLDLFTDLENHPKVIPSVFDNYLLYVPTTLDIGLPLTEFNTTDQGPKFIMIAAQAHFSPFDAGKEKPQKMFTQTFFTDPETAKNLTYFRSPIADNFPNSYVYSETNTITDLPTHFSMRASITDPFLVNPASFNGSYYFTGAMDLYPIELAQSLADEIVVSYPSSLPRDYEYSVINGVFGFSQITRALQTVNNTQALWIDMSGVDEVKFDPEPGFLSLTITDRLPKSWDEFQTGIQRQFDFGYSRMKEALTVQADGHQKRTHLREPINPKLYGDFSCKNANAWKTRNTTRVCLDDAWAGCDRRTASDCQPVR